MKIFHGAKWKPVYFSDSPSMLTGARGWVVHVPISNGSLFNYFNGLKPGSRKASTGWVAKDGSVEQYISADRDPWAQVGGNTWGTGWEFEGYANERMTDAQILTAAKIHIWLGTFQNIPDTIADSPSGRGIGTHSMGGAAWGGHACPGPIRAAQRMDILAQVHKLRNPIGVDMPLTDADVEKVLNYRKPISPGEASLWLAAGVDHRTVATGVTLGEMALYGNIASAETKKLVSDLVGKFDAYVKAHP